MFVYFIHKICIEESKAAQLAHLVEHLIFTAASWDRSPVSSGGMARFAKRDRVSFPGSFIHIPI